ncbi:FAM83G isoform 4, partial [Pan troglodytes]
DSHSGSSGRGPGPRRPSVASSVSEEYFEVREHSVPLRRRHSEQVANGPTPPPRRQLSAPHITRGTFVGPQGGSPWAQSRGREEADALKRMQAQRSTDKEAQDKVPEPWVPCSLGSVPGARPTWEQCAADHARHDDQAHGEH